MSRPGGNDLLVVHTDGACHGNPGPGGWGAFWKCPRGAVDLVGGLPLTTNNQMEMMAVWAALRELTQTHPDVPLKIRTDSQYVIKGITEWRKGWERRNWRTANGDAVKNADLWRELFALVDVKGKSLSFEWVRGHNGDAGNERADLLALEGLQLAKAHRGPGSWARRNGVLAKTA